MSLAVDWARGHHALMAVLVVKMLLAPVFVVGVSVAVQRLGQRIGGILAGIPVVAGPILLVYVQQHGRTFAAHAAGGTLLGILSLSCFVLVYARLASRVRWLWCVLAGWAVFLLATLALDHVSIAAGLALVLVGATLTVGLWLLPREPRGASVAPIQLSWRNLLLRASCALALVIALAIASGQLGPRMSGLLTPFPVITTVLAAFTHAQRGGAAPTPLFSGMLWGFFGFAIFCFALTISLRGLGTVAGFALATVAMLITQAVVISLRVAVSMLPRSPE